VTGEIRRDSARQAKGPIRGAACRRKRDFYSIA
jgi:hypothetical protein